MWVILSGDWKVAKMGEFWPKSKAIHLVFWGILTKIQCEWFWVEIEKWQKWANFGQKVRLYTWYFPYFLAKIRPFLPLFNLHSKSLTLNFCENSPKYQVYSLTFWPKFAHFCHFSISTQNHSHWIFVKIPQNTKCIALLFGQNSPIFATFQSPLKITHIEFWWKFAKIPSV